MKKIINIRVEVDLSNPERETWWKEKDFIETEVDSCLNDIVGIINRKYRNCSGVSESGASKYTVHVKNINL